jgi:hypothetical protein
VISCSSLADRWDRTACSVALCAVALSGPKPFGRCPVGRDRQSTVQVWVLLARPRSDASEACPARLEVARRDGDRSPREMKRNYSPLRAMSTCSIWPILPLGPSLSALVRLNHDPSWRPLTRIRPDVVSPRYAHGGVPAAAVTAVSGSEVWLDLTVDSDGAVARVDLLRTTPPMTEAVVALVRDWRFEPERDDAHASSRTCSSRGLHSAVAADADARRTAAYDRCSVERRAAPHAGGHVPAERGAAYPIGGIPSQSEKVTAKGRHLPGSCVVHRKIHDTSCKR